MNLVQHINQIGTLLALRKVDFSFPFTFYVCSASTSSVWLLDKTRQGT